MDKIEDVLFLIDRLKTGEMDEGPELFALYQSVRDRVVPLVVEIKGKLHLDNSNINSAYRKGKMMLQQLDMVRKGLDVLLSGDVIEEYVHGDNGYTRRLLLQVQNDYERVKELMSVDFKQIQSYRNREGQNT
jgi:hypothetical protein